MYNITLKFSAVAKLHKILWIKFAIYL